MAERLHPKKSLVRFFSSAVLAIGIGATSQDYISPTPPQPDRQNVNIVTLSVDNQSKDEPSLNPNSAEHNFSWDKNNKPTSIAIPQIDFVSRVQQVPDELKDHDTITYPTPDDGIATPQQPILDNPYIFGHSRWDHQPRTFAKISELKKGSQIMVINDSGNLIIFGVVGFRLLDEDQETITIYPTLTLQLQTTAVQNGEWLLPKDEVMEKVENPPDTTDGNFVLVITAKPIASGRIHDPNRASLPRTDNNYP